MALEDLAALITRAGAGYESWHGHPAHVLHGQDARAKARGAGAEAPKKILAAVCGGTTEVVPFRKELHATANPAVCAAD